MALETRNTNYDLTTAVKDISTPHGGLEWTIGNAGGSDIYVKYNDVAAFTGTAGQLKALADARIPPFERIIIPAGPINHVGLVMATGTAGVAYVNAGTVDPPTPTYVSLAVNLAKAATRVIVANAVANTQLWAYAVKGTCDAAGHVTLIDSTPGNGAHANANSGTGIMPVGANGGINLEAYRKTAPLFKGAAAKGLSMILPAGNDFDGIVTYAAVIV